MNTTIQIISGILETGAISFVVYMIMKGLKTEIKTLQKNVVAQNETIKTMDKRIEETEKIGDLYKRLISDFPQALDDYQAVITKTKDSTIYELKSKLEEQNLTIEELREISEKGDKQTSTRATIIGKLFLDKENKDLLQFIQNLESNKDLTFKAMFENSNFNRFLASLKKEVKYVEEEGIRDIFSSEFMEKNKARNATINRNGSYMLTFDNELIISERLFNIFKNGYESL
jgi:hypothetical protein